MFDKILNIVDNRQWVLDGDEYQYHGKIITTHEDGPGILSYIKMMYSTDCAQPCSCKRAADYVVYDKTYDILICANHIQEIVEAWEDEWKDVRAST